MAEAALASGPVMCF